MIITTLRDGDESRYEQLATECGTIFNSKRWLELFGNRIRFAGIYNDNRELIGGFHLYEEKRCGLTIFRDAPFTPHCGPFLRLAAKNPVAIMDAWKKALALMADYIEQLHPSVVSLSLATDIVDTQPFIWKKCKVTPRYTYIIDLTESSETILKRMSVERRNDLKSGERNGFKATVTRDSEIVESLVKNSFTRQSITPNALYLRKILAEYASAENSFAYVVEDNGRPLAAALCIHDQRTAYYLLGGYSQEHRQRAAGPLACWAAILHAKGVGLRAFDFEGSMVPAIESYFRGYGGRLTPYYRLNKALLPIEIVLKFIKRDLF